MRQLKADKFIGARMPVQEYGPGVPAIVCLVAAGIQQARLDPVGESGSIRHPGRTAQSTSKGSTAMAKRQVSALDGNPNRKQTRKRQQPIWTDHRGLDEVHSDAAGIDVGNNEHYVAIAPEKTSQPVQRFGCFTGDLHRLAQFLKTHGIRSVASSRRVSIGFHCMTCLNRKVSRCT